MLSYAFLYWRASWGEAAAEGRNNFDFVLC